MRAVLAEFVGDIEQVPTAVSAIKVDGKRAYQRVRDGEEVELEARPVTVHELVVHDVAPAPRTATRPPSTSRSRVRCSSGTYIRAIARDLGARLGVGGHLTALRRTAVGPFDLAAARTLDQLGEEFALLPIADAARAGFAARDLDEAQAADVRVRAPAGDRGRRPHRGVRAGRRVPRALRAAGRPRGGRGLRLSPPDPGRGRVV